MIFEIERIDELYRAVKNMALQILPTHYEDLTQEVVTKLWTRRNQIPRRFGSRYLQVVVRNAAHDFLKIRKKTIQYVRFSENENGSISPENQPDKQFFVAEPVTSYLELRDFLKVADEALEALSRQQKQTIMLCAAGFECPEIAAITGVPAGTVRTRLLYARKKLNSLIGGKWNEFKQSRKN